MSIFIKNARFKVFQYEISDRIMQTLYDIFEKNIRMKFQLERIFEEPTAFCEFSSNFKSENGFEVSKDRRIKLRGPLHCIEKRPLSEPRAPLLIYFLI